MSWQRQILRVNLSEGRAQAEPLNMEWAHDFLGERGLATKYLMENMDPKADPLGPDNVLIFATGPLSGTMASTSGRYAVVTKGPLTGAIACSNSGGKFGAELKFAGYDLLIVEGRAERAGLSPHRRRQRRDPARGRDLGYQRVGYRRVDPAASPEPPNSRWPRLASRESVGVKFACVVNDLHRAAGRSGVGAVMGSKNLKAIAVHGSVGVKVDDPKRFMRAVKDTKAVLWDNAGRAELEKVGTNAMIDVMQEFGGLPTRNFQEVQFEGVENINPGAMAARKTNGHTNLLTNKACFGCTIACGRIAHIDKEHFTVVNRKEYWHASGGLEYETAYAFGPVVGRGRPRRVDLRRLHDERARHGSESPSASPLPRRWSSMRWASSPGRTPAVSRSSSATPKP